MAVIPHAEHREEKQNLSHCMWGKLTNEERADEQGVESKLYSGISQWGGSWQCVNSLSLTTMQN